MIEPYQLTLIISIIFFIAEMLTGSLILFAFSFGFGIVSIFQFMQNGFLLERDLLILIISSTLGIFFLRIKYKKKSDEKILKDDDINHY
jgi:membrane protein implicated in regulation of membrane protease activity